MCFYMQLFEASITALVVGHLCVMSMWLTLAWHAGLNYLGNSSLVHAQSIIATLAVQVHLLQTMQAHGLCAPGSAPRV